MEIIIKGEPKEIADLVVAIQGQLDGKSFELACPDNINTDDLIEEYHKVTKAVLGY